jgi:transcriptional regulator with XRE-family HTH domain
MDREQLADFLKARREALQPEDVGLPRGRRRRTGGLRREEVAALCDMSVDYYSRIEQQRGPHPSEQMLASIARGLRLTLAERDHLFRLAGHNTPIRSLRNDHVSPGLMRILDRLEDTPAQVISGVAETLMQTRLATAMFGDETHLTGLDRSLLHRWFADETAREIYAEAERPRLGRFFTSQLREALSRDGAGSRAAAIVAALLPANEEFATLWSNHEVGLRFSEVKRFQHPRVGALELHCQVLHDPDQAQALLVYTATPGSESYEKLQLLSVIGSQPLST